MSHIQRNYAQFASDAAPTTGVLGCSHFSDDLSLSLHAATCSFVAKSNSLLRGRIRRVLLHVLSPALHCVLRRLNVRHVRYYCHWHDDTCHTLVLLEVVIACGPCCSFPVCGSASQAARAVALQPARRQEAIALPALYDANRL
jgi:hypothetical protein